MIDLSDQSDPSNLPMNTKATQLLRTLTKQGPSLVSASRSMTQASREYKGLAKHFEEMVRWLEKD